ncbi:MAG: ATP-binding protein [Anaerolineaceae bacterium]
MKGAAVIDYAACMACGSCTQFCPFGFLELEKTDVDALRKAYPRLVDGHKCTGCGICADHCPVNCITLS